jgi:cytochrome c peroxidase
VRAHYRVQYEALFGPLPDLRRLPPEGGPLGTPEQRAAWAAMSDEERRGDRAGQQLLSAQEKNGLRLFIGKAQCVTCHNGPLFSDQQFHNTGIAPRTPGRPDFGCGAALEKLLKDEFNCLGPYSDARSEQCEELRFLSADDHALDGAFKVPGLRNVAARSPYMHAGQLASLQEVVEHYKRAPAAAAGHSELKPLRLSAVEVRDLVAFLGTLSSPIVEDSR